MYHLTRMQDNGLVELDGSLSSVRINFLGVTADGVELLDRDGYG